MTALKLPAFHPRVLYSHRGKLLRCLARNQLVRATPEEIVRQRVLNWLIREKRLAKGQLKLEDSLTYADRTRGRPDVVVCDEDGRCRLIVEVKRSTYVAGHDALNQAQRYARRLAVSEVWVTNGDRHSFARKTRSGIWRPARGSVIEDRDLSPLTFRTPGGTHTSDYRVFLVATEGRVETAAIGVNAWGPNHAILCVGFLKENRKHHALQLQLDGCEMRTGSEFEIYHHGVIGGRAIGAETVFEAIRDHGRDDLIQKDTDGRTQVYLGRLPGFSSMTWRASKAFLSNLLHYAIIRTNLREARPYRARDSR